MKKWLFVIGLVGMTQVHCLPSAKEVGKKLVDKILTDQLIASSDDMPESAMNDGYDDTAPFYGLRLTDKDQERITKLITRLGDWGVFKLLANKKDMDRLGDKIAPVHPCRFLGHIFANPGLAKRMRSVNGKAFKWSSFMKGLSGRLDKELREGNLIQYLPGFAETVNRDPEVLKKMCLNRQWEKMVRYLM